MTLKIPNMIDLDIYQNGNFIYLKLKDVRNLLTSVLDKDYIKDRFPK